MKAIFVLSTQTLGRRLLRTKSKFQINHNDSDIVLSVLHQCEPQHPLVQKDQWIHHPQHTNDDVKPLFLCHSWICQRATLHASSFDTSHSPSLARMRQFFIRHYIPRPITCKNEAIVIFCPRNNCNFWFWNDEWFQISVPSTSVSKFRLAKGDENWTNANQPTKKSTELLVQLNFLLKLEE